MPGEAPCALSYIHDSSSLACRNSYCVHHRVSNSLLPLTVFGRESCWKLCYPLELCTRHEILQYSPPLFQTIMDKSLGTLLHFWGVFRFTQVQPLPSRHKQCWTRVSRIFFSTLYRVGGGRTGRNFRKGCTVLRGNREMTDKYEYCSTIPRTFLGPG